LVVILSPASFALSPFSSTPSFAVLHCRAHRLAFISYVPRVRATLAVVAFARARASTRAIVLVRALAEAKARAIDIEAIARRRSARRHVDVNASLSSWVDDVIFELLSSQ